MSSKPTKDQVRAMLALVQATRAGKWVKAGDLNTGSPSGERVTLASLKSRGYARRRARRGTEGQPSAAYEYQASPQLLDAAKDLKLAGDDFDAFTDGWKRSATKAGKQKITGFARAHEPQLRPRVAAALESRHGQYWLEAEDREPGLHVGRAFRVNRGSDFVARVFEDPSLTGGVRRYDDARVQVSTRPLVWAGPHEAKVGSPDARRGVAYLFHDFDLPGIRNAEDALPEIAVRIERALAWRREHAASERPVTVDEHRRRLPQGLDDEEVVVVDGAHAIIWKGSKLSEDDTPRWFVDVLLRPDAHASDVVESRDEAVARAKALIARVRRLALGE